jgi:hypothetical protein
MGTQCNEEGGDEGRKRKNRTQIHGPGIAFKVTGTSETTGTAETGLDGTSVAYAAPVD